jgi:2-polyprenyl-3-methyl-5-hydroxy-6-metoxy-1,4-benzoquinol methylase
MTTKDFGWIENDYAFFMAHATEAERDVDEYVRQLAGFAQRRSAIRLLDFGCGTGDFSHRLASALNWRSQAIRMTLVEPVQHQREEAARRLAPFSQHPIESLAALPAAESPPFDVVLSNHVLYYVDDLADTLRRLNGLLAPGGKMLLALAGWDNALMQLWKIGFALLGQPVPYHAADDVERTLAEQGIAAQRSTASYQLRFPDTEQNRLRILRFLFGDYLQQVPLPRLLVEFDRYERQDHIEVNTHSYHFIIDSSPTGGQRP